MLLQIQIVQALLLRAQVAFAGGGAEYQLAVVDIAAEQRVVARAHAVAGDAAAGLAQGTGVFHSCHGGVGRLQVVFGDAMAEAHDLQDRVVWQADAFGVLPGLAALNDPRAFALAAVHLAHDADGFGFIVGLDQNGVAAAADVALDRHLPIRVEYLDVVAEYPRVGLRALLADRQQRFLDIRGVRHAAALQGADLVANLADLTIQRVQRAGAFLHQPVDPLQQAGAFTVLLAQALGQLVVRTLLAANGIQAGVQRGQVDPVAGQQLIEVGNRFALGGQHCRAGLAPAAAGQLRKRLTQAVLGQQRTGRLQRHQVAVALMGLGQQAGYGAAQLLAQLALALLQLVLVLQRRNALTAGFQLHQFVVGLGQALGGQALVFLQRFELTGELLLFLFGGQIALLVVLPGLRGGSVLQPGALQPAVQILRGLAGGQRQQFHRLTYPRRFLFHAVHGAQQVADAFDGVAKLARLQHFLGDKLVDGFDRFVGHEIGKGARGVLGFAGRECVAAAAQRGVQTGEIGALAVVDFDLLGAELLAQQARQLGHGDHVAAVILLAQKVRQREHLAGNDHQQQFVLPRLAAAAGGVEMGAYADYRGKGFGGLATGRVEHPGDVAVGIPGAGVGAVVTAEHVGGEGTHLLAAAAALGGFVLSRVVVEQVVVGGGHQRLQGVRCGGLAGAVAAGEQVDRAVFQFFDRQVAPVDGNRTLQIHQLLSSADGWSSLFSISGLASWASALSVTRLMMPGRIVSQASPLSSSASLGLRISRSWRRRRSRLRRSLCCSGSERPSRLRLLRLSASSDSMT